MSIEYIVLCQLPGADGYCPEFPQKAPPELSTGKIRPEQMAFTHYGLVFVYSKVRIDGTIEYKQVETLELVNL